MSPHLLLVLIVIFPIIAALINALFCRNLSFVSTCIVATAGVFASFTCTAILFANLHINHVPSITVNLFDWLAIPVSENKIFTIPFGLTFDKLSTIFVFLTTGVGSLIHMYSGEYMDEEKRTYRYFVYLNLFITSMLLLVLGENMLVTFLGWEGVGVCSYLLVGYWYENSEKSLAAVKAFIVNRIGDAGFLFAMFLCYKIFGTISYSALDTQIATLVSSNLVNSHLLAITLISFGLLFGVTGKSAQIPLYTWLPDAMAGPTPVSALIHAATMVTAGIYLLNRVSHMLILSPLVMHTIATIGAVTALYAATMALAQYNIKKVLAYSTCSQLGYMVLGCGVGAFDYGVAHVIAHGFFKACLFLGAGSIIHKLHHEEDMRKMGGLLKKMPITSWCFFLAVLAIIGIPPFASFFTKDAILEAAFAGPFGNPIFWFIGYIAAGLTTLYMLRLTLLTFFGRCRYDHPEKIRESSPVMTIPLIILAILSTFGGAVLLIFPKLPIPHHIEIRLMAITTLLVVLAMLFQIFFYRKGISGGAIFGKIFGPIYVLVRDKYYIDEIYQAIFTRPLAKIGSFLYRIFDRNFIDGIVNGLPKSFYFGTSVMSDAQAGSVRNYLKLMFFGLIILFFTLVFYLMH